MFDFLDTACVETTCFIMNMFCFGEEFYNETNTFVLSNGVRGVVANACSGARLFAVLVFLSLFSIFTKEKRGWIYLALSFPVAMLFNAFRCMLVIGHGIAFHDTVGFILFSVPVLFYAFAPDLRYKHSKKIMLLFLSLSGIWLSTPAYANEVKVRIGSVRFPYTDIEVRYLYDAGSYVTNDLVHVEWTRSPVVPESADFIGAYRHIDSTNDTDWAIFYESDFIRSKSPLDIPFKNAVSNDFQFFTTFTPGPTIHTNGGAVILWQLNFKGESDKCVPFRTGIYSDGVRLAPNNSITNGPAASKTTTNYGEVIYAL